MYFSEIPEVLREDFQSFICGKTNVKRNNEWAPYHQDVVAWCEKLNSAGVDYPLNLNGTPGKITEIKNSSQETEHEQELLTQACLLEGQFSPQAGE